MRNCLKLNKTWLIFSAVFFAARISILRGNEVADSEIYIPQGPILQDFSLDLNTGQLIFVFDQLVAASTFNLSCVTLQSNRTGELTYFKFQEEVYNNLTKDGNTTEILTYMGPNDFARLKSISNIGKSVDNTFVSLEKGLCLSSIEVLCEIINSTSPLQALEVSPDNLAPYFNYFGLNMDDGYIVIGFNEPMNVSTFQMDGLALQIVSNSLHSKAYVRLERTVAQCHVSYDYDRKVLCPLERNNILKIQMIENLCVGYDTCFLSAHKSFIEDISGNTISIEGSTRINGLAVTSFVEDRTPPLLDSWELDLNAGIITLEFSEVIYVPLFNYSKIVLCNSSECGAGDFSMRVVEPVVTHSHITERIFVHLNPQQFNIVRYETGRHFAVTPANTFIILEPGIAVDTTLRLNVYEGVDAAPGLARMVSNLTLDTISPRLDHVVVDMNYKLLKLRFSEVVSVDSVQVNEILLQSKINILVTTETIMLPATGSLLTTDDSYEIDFSLTQIFSKIKKLNHLCHSLEECYISLTYRFVTDMDGNQVVEIPHHFATRIDEFIPDSTPPTLLSWSFDHSREQISLEFSETVDLDTFDIKHLTLLDGDMLGPATSAVTLTAQSIGSDDSADGQSYVYKQVYNILYIQVGKIDMNSIKRSAPLCSSNATCYLYLEGGVGYDVSTTGVNGTFFQNEIVLLEQPLACYRFASDIVPPRLEFFDLDLGVGRINLYFSEPVLSTNFNSTGISLYLNGTESNAILLELSEGTYSESTDSPLETLTLLLTRQDFFTVKRSFVFRNDNNGLYRDSSLYLAVESSTFQDTVGNLINGSSSGEEGVNAILNDFGNMSFVIPSAFIEDDSGPSIIAMSTYKKGVDRNITLYLDDVVDSSSARLQGLVLASFQAIRIVTLASANIVSTGDSLSDSIQISLDNVALGPLIHSNQKNSYVYMAINSVLHDAYGNPSSRISSVNAIREGPAIIRFALNMNTGVLTIEFVQSVSYLIKNIKAVNVKIVNTESLSRYILNGFLSMKIHGGGYLMDLRLTANDLVLLRRSRIVTQKEKIVLSLDSIAMINDRNLELNDTTSVACVQLIKDTSIPAVEYFNLNLGLGILGIKFSKYIQISSLILSKIHLQSASSSAAFSVQLNQSELTSEYKGMTTALYVEIDLNAGSSLPTDRDRIHLSGGDLSGGVASSKAKTYLVVERSFVKDTSFPPNYMHEIPPSSALQVTTLIADRILPFVTSYELNLRERNIKLTYSESVSAASNIPKYYSFLADALFPTSQSFTLTSSSKTSNVSLSLEATREIIIELSTVDVDNLMLLYPRLCSSIINSYLYFTSGAIRDISYMKNTIGEVYKVFAIAPTTYVRDDVAGQVDYFDFSLATGLLYFRFSEMMDCRNTIIDQIRFQYRRFIGTSMEYYDLKSNSTFLLYCNDKNYITRDIYLQLGTEDFVRLKTFSRLANTNLTTFISFQENTFYDIVGNGIEATADGHALAVRYFTPDTTPPKLVAFTTSQQHLLFLRFDEPMNERSFHIEELFVSNKRDRADPEDAVYHIQHLTKSTLLQEMNAFHYQFTFTIDDDFLDKLRWYGTLLSQDMAFMSITSNLIADSQGNQVEEIPVRYSLNAGPALMYWDLNLLTNEMVLYFSEGVFYNFSAKGMVLYNAADIANATVSVTILEDCFLHRKVYENRFFGADAVISLTLSIVDMINIKSSGLVTDRDSNAFLYAPLGLTRSTFLGSRPPSYNSTETQFGVPLSFCVYDTLGASILYIELDLDAGSFLVLFDEPINGESVDLSQVTLFSLEFGTSVDLSSVYVSSYGNTSSIMVSLHPDDLNMIKSANDLHPLNKAIFQPAFVKDLFGNPLDGDAEVNGAFVTAPLNAVVPDVTPPILEDFVIDFAAGKIYLHFDEIVEYDSVAMINFMLFSTFNSSSPTYEKLRLSNYTLLEGDITDRNSNITLDLRTLRKDEFMLQVQSYIGEGITTTYLHISGIRDISGNVMLESNVSCAGIIADYSRPRLESFDLSFAPSGALASTTLYFNEAIEIATFDCSEFSFSASQGSSGVAPSKPSCTVLSTQQYSRYVRFTFPNSIFTGGYSTIGQAVESTWLYAPTPLLTLDFAGNVLSPILVNNAIRVGPQITDLFLDLNDGSMAVVVSNDVDMYSSINSSAWKFQSSLTGLSFSLTNDSYVLRDYFGADVARNFLFVIELGPYDFMNIQHISGQMPKNTLLVSLDLTSQIFDANNFALSSDFIRATITLLDKKHPVVKSLTLNMSSNLILFELSEPIRVDAVVPSRFSIQSNSDISSSGSAFAFTSTEKVDWVILGNSYFYYFYLSNEDSMNIKLNPLLAKDLSSSFLSMEYGGMLDIAGNDLPTISSSNAVAFDIYVDDAIAPNLQTMDLDMQRGVLTLTFDEPMSLASLDVTGFVLQSRFGRGVERMLFYRLTENSYGFGNNGSAITIQIGNIDMYNIKNTYNLARKQTSSYVTMLNYSIADISGNFAVPVVVGSAVPCRIFIADTTKPTITSISANFEKNTLTFHMSELVETGTVDITAVSVFSNSDGTGRSYVFTSSSNVLTDLSVLFATDIEFQLSLFDVNQLQALYPLASSAATSYFAVREYLCTDVFWNEVNPISLGSLLSAKTYDVDNIPPKVTFFELDMNSLHLSLTFSESVSQDSIHLNDILVQSTATKRYGKFTNLLKTTPQVGLREYSNYLDIYLDRYTSNLMKQGGIGKQKSSSFLSFGDVFISDSHSNFIDPVWDHSVLDSDPLVPDVLVVDSSAPKLENWYIDRKTVKIYLRFDEPVALVNCGGIGLQVNNLAIGFSGCSMEYSNFGAEVVLDIQKSFTSMNTSKCKVDEVGSCTSLSLFSQNVISAIQDSTSSSNMLYITENTFLDLALAANGNKYIAEEEGGPVCSECGEGEYVYKRCTTSADRVCRKCSTCGVGNWMVSACTPVQDTRCQVCSDCPYGTYIGAKCSATSDTKCSACATCGPLQFESRRCVGGLNTLCDSCEYCDFIDDFMAKSCGDTSNYKYWKDQNCCSTKEGTQVPCRMVVWKDMQIIGKDGQHTLIFDHTSPPLADGNPHTTEV